MSYNMQSISWKHTIIMQKKSVFSIWLKSNQIQNQKLFYLLSHLKNL